MAGIFMMKDKIVFLAVIGLVSFSTPGFGQVKGKVTDNANDLPLSDTQIFSAGKLLEVTNSKGLFHIAEGEYADSLIFKKMGYKNKIVVSANDSLLFVEMHVQPTTLKGVAVKALSYSDRAFRAPASLNIFYPRQIERISLSDPAPLLNSAPGLFAHTGAHNTHRITSRGIGARSMYSTTKLRAYLNEIPLTSAMGETTLADLDLGFIDRISVVKGPSSTLYGSSLGATVLYRIGSADDEENYLEINNSLGSYNMTKSAVELSWQEKNVSLKLALNRFVDDGFRQNDDYNREGYTLIFNNRFNTNTKLTLLSRFHAVKAYIPSSLSKLDFENTPEIAADNWRAVNGHEDYSKWWNGLSFAHHFNSAVSYEASIFHKAYTGYERRPFNTLEDNTQTAGARSVVSFDPRWFSFPTHFNAGFEIYYDKYHWATFETLAEGRDGIKITDNRQHRYYSSFFASARFTGETVTFEAGLNTNNTRYKVNDQQKDSIDFSSANDFGWVASPRLALTWHLSEEYNLYGTLSHGFSAPSFEEAIDSEGFANTSLNPETGWNREVGIRMRQWDGRIRLVASLFSMHVKNLLVTKRLSEERYTKINAGETIHNGVEAAVSLQLLKQKEWKARLNTSYTYADYSFLDFTDDGENFDGNHLPGVAENKIFASLNVEFPKNFFLYTDVLWVDEMPLSDANTLYSDAYHRLNLKAGWSARVLERWRVDVYAGVRNFTNQHYASMVLINAVGYGGEAPRYYYPGKPRNYYGGVKFRYRL